MITAEVSNNKLNIVIISGVVFDEERVTYSSSKMQHSGLFELELDCWVADIGTDLTGYFLVAHLGNKQMSITVNSPDGTFDNIYQAAAVAPFPSTTLYGAFKMRIKKIAGSLIEFSIDGGDTHVSSLPYLEPLSSIEFGFFTNDIIAKNFSINKITLKDPDTSDDILFSSPWTIEDAARVGVTSVDPDLDSLGDRVKIVHLTEAELNESSV